MPKVKALVHRSKAVNDELLEEVMRALPTIIATNLDVSDLTQVRLVPEDVNIKLTQGSLLDDRHKDIEVMVSVNAKKFDARIQAKPNCSEKMARDMRNILPKELTGFIWVYYIEEFFTEF